mgnify:CR=1 FL=1
MLLRPRPRGLVRRRRFGFAVEGIDGSGDEAVIDFDEDAPEQAVAGGSETVSGKLVLEVIARINVEIGTTVIVITHNASIARMADRVLHLGDGRLQRIHPGYFVVFSGVLNDNMEVLAVEGSYASVIGGAPAAAVVFTVRVRSLANFSR